MTSKKRRRAGPELGKTRVASISSKICKINTHSTFVKQEPLAKSSILKKNLEDEHSTIPVKNLDLSRVFPLDLEMARKIGQRWSKGLLSMNLEYSLLTDTHLAAILGDEQLTAPVVAPLSLRKLNLSYTNITDIGIRYVALRCPNLTSINLKGCSKITNLSLSLLAKHCKHISLLNISECKVTNYGVQIVAQESKSNLAVLDINDCREITDDALNYLSFYCPNLKRLRLRGTRVTSVGIIPLVQRQAFLELNLQGLPITDETLLVIAKNQILIQILDISFCHQVTATSINEVIKGCALLKEIHLFGKNLTQNPSPVIINTVNPNLNIRL